MQCGGLPRHLLRDRRELHRCELQVEARVRARERQQAVREPCHALALPNDVGGCGAAHFLLDVRAHREQARVALDGGKRRAQLVGSVGHETALRVQRALQRREHAVEAGRQQCHFVAAPADSEAPAEVLRASDVISGARDQAQRAQGPARHQPRRDERSEKGGHCRDDQKHDHP